MKELLCLIGVIVVLENIPGKYKKQVVFLLLFSVALFFLIQKV